MLKIPAECPEKVSRQCPSGGGCPAADSFDLPCDCCVPSKVEEKCLELDCQPEECPLRK